MAGVHRQPRGRRCARRGDERRAQSPGTGLLSGSPGRLPPAMDGGLVPLPGRPRWLLLSGWLQGGSRSRGHHRVPAGMRSGAGVGGCGVGPPPCAARGDLGGESPGCSPRAGRRPGCSPQGGHPLPARGAAGKGSPGEGPGWPWRPVGGLGVGCRGVTSRSAGLSPPDTAPRGLPGRGGAGQGGGTQPSTVIPAMSLSSLSRSSAKECRGMGLVRRVPKGGGGCVVSPCCHPKGKETTPRPRALSAQHIPTRNG